jgi:phage-related tail fiber protein
MAEAITVNAYRRRLAAAMAGGPPVSPAAYMAFGDGGHNTDLTAKAPSRDQESLNNEIVRKPLLDVSQEDLYSMTGRGFLETSDLIGVPVSEAALIDANGEIIGLKNFAPKVKESDERYEVSIKLRF